MSRVAIQNLPTVFTHADAQALGISDRTLSQLRHDGEIDRLARGIYAHPDLAANPDFVEIAVRAPKATLCLTTALAHHELTDDIPQSTNAALPRQQRSPKTAAPVTWHRFDNRTFSIGRDSLPLTDQLAIGLYNPIRSIIDAYRLAHLYGIDQAHEALKRWLHQRGNQPSELLAMTKDFPTAEPTIRTTLETLL